MAEVLSQSQIDALLSAARSGENISSTPQQSEEQKYRKYNFYSPRKFTKDRLKMLSGIFENYTRVINSRINGLLRTNCEIEVESVEEQRYYEFSNALSEGDVLSIVGVTVQDKPQTDSPPVLFHFNTSLMLSMMDRLMGGDGNEAMKASSGYTFTNLELQLYESLVKDIIGSLGNSWENYIDMEFAYRRVENNPTLVQLMGLDETVVIVGINMKFSNGTGRMSVCLPGMLLTNVFAKIAAANQMGRGVGEDNSEEIMGILKGSDLEIKAELGRTTLHLEDIFHLKVGDVIDLGQPATNPVLLYVGGRPWFTGKIGMQNSSMAVKVIDTCDG